MSHWPIGIVTLAVLVLAWITAHIHGEVHHRKMYGLPIPTWLARLERLRQYLANEPD